MPEGSGNKTCRPVWNLFYQQLCEPCQSKDNRTRIKQNKQKSHPKSNLYSTKCLRRKDNIRTSFSEVFQYML
ncbi:hypothetical protein CHS0354_028853 [Potamilus streckersoni]|uniref:Uncharacterized protein n=1 Tax=Potamilus streckersoni TaxID=2493646 RepID=A0AAE0TGP8_9BIVA|nr:hypothetical protein CHS0354_028853 [Potamilus streckersoni]